MLVCGWKTEGQVAVATQFIPLLVLDPEEGLRCGFWDRVPPSRMGVSP